ncbi:MAG: ABC transporter ATP-binding protein [Eubacteriales bacterium]
MKKLAKYLKPYSIILVLVLLLLFGQAMSDLNLPNYMSKIVNVGIQQNGVEEAAPKAISQAGMKLMQTFMLADEKKLVQDNYTLVSGTDKNAQGKTYVSLYPNAKDTQIYVRNSVSASISGQLDITFGNATWTFINVMQEYAKQQGQTAAAGSGTVNVKNLDFAKLYAMQPKLDMMPESVVQTAHDKAVVNDQAILKQSAAAFTGSFYKELGINLTDIQTSYILKIGGAMLLIALLGGLASIFVSLFSSRIAAGVARTLRVDIFNRIESFSNNEFDKFSTASLITRSTNDVTQIQTLLTIGVRMLLYAPIMAVGGVIMAVNKSASMSWIIAVACIVLIGMILIVLAVTLPRFKLVQKLIDNLNLVARENLSGLMVIRAFGTRDFEKDRFDKANKDLTKVNLFINRTMSFMMPAMMLIMNAVMLLVVWVGAHQISESTMQVGDMMAFMQYAMQIIMSFLMIAMMFIFVPRAAVSANRIAEVLETYTTIIDPPNPKSLETSKKGYVEFKDVNFRYHGADEDVLSDITFTARPGETTAFIGSTGSGKSTLVNLILRFYDVTKGQILINDVDVREVSQKELRSHIGYVPQKGVLLSGTIASNLRYGKKDATDEEILTASQVAQAMEFIDEKTDRFESEISQGGDNVSGGQKQRLSIARALVKRAQIYIFDDSFSALDFQTDIALRKALKANTGDSTLLIVAQRVSTIMNAEQIIVLDNGRIVGKGTHRELLASCPEYYEIASSQLSKEELE